MGRAGGGGGGQRIQPASLTSMCTVHCLRQQNSLYLDKMGYLVSSEVALTQCFLWKSFRVDLTLYFDQMLRKQ